MSKATRGLALLLALFGMSVVVAQPISYQGQLQDTTGPYNDGPIGMEFRLFDSPTGGTQVGNTVVNSAVEVTDGLFQVELDFGNAWTGADRYLEIMVAGQTLSPRQRISPVPLAVSSINDSDTTYSAGAGLQLSGTTFTLDTAVTDDRYWSRSGDAGTNPGSDFLGTLDAVPFEIRTSGSRHLRLEPSAQVASGEPITANLIGGSSVNNVATGVRGATIAGGGMPSGDTDPVASAESPNRVESHYGTVGGGYANTAGDPNDLLAGGVATISGGLANIASSNKTTIGGGAANTASGSSSTVAGGESNTASALYSTVAGGRSNEAGESRSNVGGGALNSANGDSSTVGGGSTNTASGSFSTVSGGVNNLASSINSAVGGGSGNTASGWDSTVAGGIDNCAGGQNSFAAGNRAKVRPGSNSGSVGDGCDAVAVSGDADGDEGTFIWSDSQTSDFVSTGPNQFVVRASGGVWFGDSGSPSIQPGAFLDTSTGASLSDGGTWTNSSSRHSKTDFRTIDPSAVLGRLLEIPVKRWRYRAENDDAIHLGPMAEDFHEAFGLGSDERSISTVDADGVALAAIQGLNEKLETRNEALRARIAEVESRNAELEKRLAAQRERTAERLEALESVLRDEGELTDNDT